MFRMNRNDLDIDRLIKMSKGVGVKIIGSIFVCGVGNG